MFFVDCMHLRRGDFQSDFFHMQACGDLASGLELGPTDGGEHLATVVCCEDIGPDKSDVARIQTETEIVEHLARMSKVLWDMYDLESEPTSLSNRKLLRRAKIERVEVEVRGRD